MKKKFVVFFVSVIIIALATLFFVSCEYLSSVHYDTMLSINNTDSWLLQNDEFTIVPTIDDNVTFQIEDKEGKVKFVCDKKWRAWDFKSLKIGSDDNVEIITGDMGKEIYVYNGETWIESLEK